ncbi:MAG: electron transfer flavoprotein subunit alpha/FixB family protein [Planctomycetota bacterium]
MADAKGIWVVVQHGGGAILPVTFELLGKARELATASGHPLTAVILGAGVKSLAEEVRHYGPDVVRIADNPALAEAAGESRAEALKHLVKTHSPAVVLVAGTLEGKSLAARAAAGLGTGLLADCVELTMNASGILEGIRPAYGGNVLATVVVANARPQMATVRPKVFPRRAREDAAAGVVREETLPADLPAGRVKLLELLKDAQGAENLAEADTIVSGGRGIGKPESFALVRELADAVGGVVGASRAAVDAGWIPYRHQVGQTGVVVRPKLYIALGISGAIQHQVGMRSAGTIVAINRDPAAPIFELAHIGIVGDLFEVVPALIQEIKALK